MKKINIGLAVFIFAMLGACDRPLEPPEVNDENCKSETMLKWANETVLPKEQIWKFTDQCRRHRSKLPEINEENCKPENIKKWGEAKGFGEPARVWEPGSLAPD